MKVFITGAAGLIGSNAARLLLEEGHAVVGLDVRQPTPEGVLFDVLERIEFIVGDVADSALVNSVVSRRQVTHILHGAAIVADQADAQPISAIRVNIEGTLNVLEAARLFDLERVVVLSSSSVNGTHANRVLEDALTEDDIDWPYGSMYPVHKLANEGQVQVYRNLYGLSVVACRPSRVWGPGYARFDLPIPIALMMRDAIAGKDICWESGADVKMDITYVRDVCRGLLQLLSIGTLPSPVYTLSGGRLISVAQIADVMRSVFPEIKIEIGPGLDYDRGTTPYTIGLKPYNDISRARREIGYDPEYGINRGIPAYAAWLRDRAYV